MGNGPQWEMLSQRGVVSHREVFFGDTRLATLSCSQQPTLKIATIILHAQQFPLMSIHLTPVKVIFTYLHTVQLLIYMMLSLPNATLSQVGPVTCHSHSHLSLPLPHVIPCPPTLILVLHAHHSN
jgi:hypothetical protein